MITPDADACSRLSPFFQVPVEAVIGNVGLAIDEPIGPGYAFAFIEEPRIWFRPLEPSILDEAGPKPVDIFLRLFHQRAIVRYAVNLHEIGHARIEILTRRSPDLFRFHSGPCPLSIFTLESYPPGKAARKSFVSRSSL